MRHIFDVERIKRIARLSFPVFRQNGILARMLDDKIQTDVDIYERFRYRYYCEEFKWLDENEDHKEHDQYDEHAAHFGALDDEGNLIGYSRFILPGKHGLQIDNEFEQLVHPRVANLPNVKMSTPKLEQLSVESSRLVVIHEAGPKRHDVAQLIYKLKYQFMKRFGFRYWYLVSEMKVIRALKFQGYPFRIIGEGKEYHGLVRYPAVMDIHEVDSILIREKPSYYMWLNEGMEYETKMQPQVHPDHEVITDILRIGSAQKPPRTN